MRPPRILHDDSVVIVSVASGLPDANGVPTTTTTETAWKGVNVQQVSAEELADHQRETSTTYFRVSGPPAEVRAGDRIKWRGQEYEIEGEPDTRTGRFRINHTSLVMYISEG